MTSRRRAFVTLLASVTTLLLAVSGPSMAQQLPTPGGPSTTTTTEAPAATTTTTTSTTSTTAPSQSTTTTTSGPGLLDPDPGGPASSTSTTTTTAPPNDAGGDEVFDDSTEAPEGSGTGEEADGEAPATTPRTIPPEAQAIINAYPRTAASNNAALLAGIEELVDLGLSRDEAIRIGFGRFPIGGAANYSHDWLYPRFGPGFRFHLGTDVFATYGTPLRSPVDGIIESSVGDLGGLYTKIFMPDGTYFYYAHLSALVDGFENGMAVQTGDVIGYVGDSGNARGGAPHLHIGIYPQGGSAVDPKPILDQFLADAEAQLPAIIAAVREQRAVQGPVTSAAPTFQAPADPMLETALLRSFTNRVVHGPLATADLYAATASPVVASTSFLDAEATRIVADIDWVARAEQATAADALAERTERLAQFAFDTFMDGDSTADEVLAGGSGG